MTVDDKVALEDTDGVEVKLDGKVALRDTVKDTVAQDDCVSDAVNEALAVMELVYDALPLRLVDSVGDRD